MIWDVLKKAFLDTFIPREKSEVKEVELVNLHQGGMIFIKYSLKLNKFSKYYPSLVSDPKD